MLLLCLQGWRRCRASSFRLATTFDLTEPTYFWSFAIKPWTSSWTATNPWETAGSGVSGGSALSMITLPQLSFERHKIEEQSVLLEREVVHGISDCSGHVWVDLARL